MVIQLSRDQHPEKPWTGKCFLCQTTERFPDEQARWFWENDHYRACPVLKERRRDRDAARQVRGDSA